jgi:hypothetical protein
MSTGGRGLKVTLPPPQNFKKSAPRKYFNQFYRIFLTINAKIGSKIVNFEDFDKKYICSPTNFDCDHFCMTVKTEHDCIFP